LPTVYFPSLSPYGLAKYVVLLTGISLIILMPLDWAFPSGTRAMALSVDNADRTIPQVVRTVVLFLMIGYISLTGWDPGAYGFVPGRALFLLATYMFISAFFYPSGLTSRLLIGVKSLLWIVAAIASHRLTLGGYLSAAKIRYIAGTVVILASAFTIPFCLESGRSIGQNADSSVLLWCIPLLLLLRPPLWASALSGLASIAILMTVKRGAVLALFAGALVYSALLIRTSFREREARGLIVAALIVAVVASGLAWQWENVQYRMEQDKGEIGSGRGWFYRVIISEWYNSDMFCLLLGRGFFTVPETLERYGVRIYAHSDWLEILHDMGVLGVVLFAYLHYRILLVLGHVLRQRDPVAPALAFGYCAFALRNVYSQCVVGESTTIYFGLLLGYSVAVVERGQEWTAD
jgi:hypothetical protein